MSSARHKSILPWWLISLLLAACGAGVWLLLPDDSQLVDQLVRDRSYKEARRVLEKLTPRQRARNAAHYRFLDIQLARLMLPANAPAADVEKFWRDAILAWRESNFPENIFQEFFPVIPRLSDPAAAWAIAAQHTASAPEAQRTRLAAELTKAALAAGQPATAAEIFAASRAAAPSVAERLELARLWTQAGRPAEALAALGEQADPALAARRVELLRELNRNREAFELLRTQANAAPNQTPDAPLAEQLANVVLASGQPAEAVPFLQRYLAGNPTDLAAQRRLRDLLTSAGRPAEAVAPAQQAATLSKRAAEDVRALAKLLEYSGQPGAAFDAWLELGLTGDLPAVERLVALNPGLYRDADLARALDRVVPVPGRPEYTLRLARNEMNLGRYDKAAKLYEQYIAAVPTDAGVMVELAHLHAELYRFPEGELWLRRALALKPGDLTLRREIAESLVLQNRNNFALGTYAELARETDSEDILGPYIRLAETLGRYEDFTQGLRRRIDRDPSKAARDYLLLAYGYELLDDPVRRQAALDEAVKRFAQNDDLRLQLAVTLAGQKKYVDAQAALASHEGLHDNPLAALLYLDLMRLNNDTAAERRYLSAPLAPALGHDEGTLQRLARAYEAIGDSKAAERTWRQLVDLRPEDFEHAASLAGLLLKRGHTGEARRLLEPFLRTPTPAVLKLSAEISEAAGDHRAAEKYQLAYLAALKTPAPTDWSALGDIRLSRGDRTGAKRAYAEALKRMQLDMTAKGTAR